MRFLADMGVATSTVRALVSAGHDAVHLSALGLQRLADDISQSKTESGHRGTGSRA